MPVQESDLAQGTIITVNGPIAADQMGVTLPHEHVMVDFIGAAETGPHRWDRGEVIRVALPHLERAKRLGCATLIECTPMWIGRDPTILRTLAQRTGMHFLTNTGCYAAGNGKYIPPDVQALPANELAARWIAEAERGIDGTGILPGFIKIGVNGVEKSPDHDLRPLTELDRKLAAAAAITHTATGLSINAHTGDADALEILDVLADHRVAAEAFVWVHAQSAPIGRALEAAQRGAWVSFDWLSEKNTQAYAERVARFMDAGLHHRLLLSHDRGWYHVGEPGGGEYKPYTPLFESLLPALRESGVGDDVIDRLIRVNPAEAFAVRVRGADG